MSAHFYKAGELVHPATPGALPSPTTILEVAKNKDLQRWREQTIERESAAWLYDFMSDASEKGTRIHEAIEILDRGEDAGCAEEDIPYIQGYCNWLAHLEKQGIDHDLVSSELYVQSDKHGYGGRLDKFDLIDSIFWVIDIKTGSSHHPEHGLQLAAYKQAVHEQTGIPKRNIKTAVLKLTDKTKKGWQWKPYNEPLKPFLGLKAYFDWQFKKNPPKPVWDGGTIRREA